MKDYIEREAVLELLRKWADSYIEIEAASAIRGITAIPAADVQGGWIPCSERLPEDEGYYLVSYRFKSKLSARKESILTMRCVSGKKGLRWDTGGMPIKISAWMPLPEPYEEADNGEV